MNRPQLEWIPTTNWWCVMFFHLMPKTSAGCRDTTENNNYNKGRNIDVEFENNWNSSLYDLRWWINSSCCFAMTWTVLDPNINSNDNENDDLMKTQRKLNIFTSAIFKSRSQSVSHSVSQLVGGCKFTLVDIKCMKWRAKQNENEINFHWNDDKHIECVGGSWDTKWMQNYFIKCFVLSPLSRPALCWLAALTMVAWEGDDRNVVFILHCSCVYSTTFPFLSILSPPMPWVCCCSRFWVRFFSLLFLFPIQSGLFGAFGMQWVLHLRCKPSRKVRHDRVLYCGVCHRLFG